MKSWAWKIMVVLCGLATILVIVQLPRIEERLSPPARRASDPNAPVPPGQRYAGLDSPLAGGLRMLLLDGQVEITADSVVVGKKKVGVFRLGVFNEIVASNLRVTLRPEACERWRARTAPVAAAASDPYAGGEPSKALSMSSSATESAPVADASTGRPAVAVTAPAQSPAQPAPSLLATATGVLASIAGSTLAGNIGKQRISTVTVSPFAIIVERGGDSNVTILACGKAVPEISSASARIVLSGDVRLRNLSGVTWRAKQAVVTFESARLPVPDGSAGTIGHTPVGYLLLKHGLPTAIVDSTSIALTDGELASTGGRSSFRHMEFPLALLVAERGP